MEGNFYLRELFMAGEGGMAEEPGHIYVYFRGSLVVISHAIICKRHLLWGFNSTYIYLNFIDQLAPMENISLVCLSWQYSENFVKKWCNTFQHLYYIYTGFLKESLL